jgi:hypothetical protein
LSGPGPNSDILVADVVSRYGGEQWVRVVGLDRTDYLTNREALALARALVAVASSVDER